jgi:hypothetical protein
MLKSILRTPMQGLLWAAAGLLAALPLATPSSLAAGAPTAIVEDSDPGRSDIGLFEMLESGRKIALKQGERLVLGYLRSCIQETVTGGPSGGQVVIGKMESMVTGGQVKRAKVECTGGQIGLDKSTKGKAGVVVFRKAPKRNAAAKPRTLTLRDTGPFIHLTAPAGKVYLRRLDQPGPAKGIGVSGNSVDLRAAGITLAPGGSYEIAANGRRVRLNISPNAGGGISLLGRLVVL